MWDNAHGDREIKEITSTGNYEVHPPYPVEAGDLLISEVRHVHPALTKPIPSARVTFHLQSEKY